MPLPETQESAEEALRRLRADVAAFRSPSVRDILFSDPPADPEPVRTMEELEAQLITMRTSLSTAKEKIGHLEKELISASQSSQRDRDECESLKLKLTAQARRLTAECDAQEARANELEKQHIDAVSTAAENAALLKLATGGVVSEAAENAAKLSAARAALATAEPALSRARADLAAARSEAEVDRVVAADTAAAFRKQLRTLVAENADLRRARDAATAGMSQESTAAARAADSAMKEIAELRAENAARAEEALRLREEAAARTAQLRDARAEARRNAAAAADAPRLQMRIEKLAAAERNAQNDRAVIEALREEKEALARLIGALAPSGAARDGLAVLREAARRRAEGKDTGIGPVPGEKVMAAEPTVTRAELVALSHRLSAHASREADAERAAKEAATARDEALADARRNKRLRKILERERNYLRDALADAENEIAQPGAQRQEEISAAMKRATAAESVAAEYRQLADELGNTLREKEAQLTAAAAAGVPGASSGETARPDGVHRDLCVLLRAQLRDAGADMESAQQARALMQRERDEARQALQYAQKELMQSREGAKEAGDYDERTTKVMTLADNPLFLAAAETGAQMDSDPLGELKKRVRKDVEQGDAEMKDVGGEGGVDRTEVQQLLGRLAEVEKLNKELEQTSKVGQRTGELAKRKINEMRSLLWNVFGWELKTHGAFFTLASIYAEREDEALEFALMEKNTFKLRPGPYTDRLTEEIELYLRKQDSIPAFMAAITLDNVSKTTIAMNAGTMT